MTQVLRWLAPGEIATDLSERIDNGSEPRFALTVNAEESSIGSSTVVVRDPDGDFHIVGLNRFDVQEEDSISDDPFIYVGRFDERREKRGLGYLTGASRIIECNLVDLNAIASNYIVGDTEDANRPEEDHEDRIAWLLGTDACALLTDDSLVLITTTQSMPAYDYTGMSPQQVIEDCARASGYQHFIWFNGADEEFGLAYAQSGGDWYTTDIRLSNVPSEVDDSTTFYLGNDAELSWDPSRVASRVFARGDGIDTVRTNDDTEDLFARRDVAMDFPTVRSGAVLNARTDRALANDLDTETVTVKGSVYLPSTHASKFKAGMKFDLHATHLTGYQEEFGSARLLNTTHELITPILYKVGFEAEPLEAPGLCFEGATPSGHYPPNNSLTTPADNIVYYVTAGEADPIPGVEYEGNWHFPVLGTGGDTDFAGYLVGNSILVGVVGAGTLTIQTAVSGGATSVGWVYGSDLTGLVIVNVIDTGSIAAGASLVVEVDTDGGAECVHWVSMNFHSIDHVLVGFTGADWESTEV